MSEKQKKARFYSIIRWVILIVIVIFIVPVISSLSNPDNIGKSTIISFSVIAYFFVIYSAFFIITLIRIQKPPLRKDFTYSAILTGMVVKAIITVLPLIILLCYIIFARNAYVIGTFLIYSVFSYTVFFTGESLKSKYKWLKNDPSAPDVMFYNELVAYSLRHHEMPDDEIFKWFSEPPVIETLDQFNQGLFCSAYLYHQGDYQTALPMTLRLIREAPAIIKMPMMYSLKIDALIMMCLTNTQPDYVRACFENLKPYLLKNQNIAGRDCARYAALCVYYKLAEKNDAAAEAARRKYYENFEKSLNKEILQSEKDIIDRVCGSVSEHNEISAVTN